MVRDPVLDLVDKVIDFSFEISAEVSDRLMAIDGSLHAELVAQRERLQPGNVRVNGMNFFRGLSAQFLLFVIRNPTGSHAPQDFLLLGYFPGQSVEPINSSMTRSRLRSAK